MRKLDAVRFAVYLPLAVLIFAATKYYGYLSNLAEKPQPETRALSETSGRLGSEPLYIVLKRAGLQEPKLSEVAGKLKKIINPRELRAGDAYLVAFSTSGVFHRLTVTRGLRRYCVAGIKNGGLSSAVIEIPVYERVKTVSGKIRGSLWNSMIAKGASPQDVMLFADIFSWNIDFLTETREGDKYALAISIKETADGTRVEEKALAAVYDGRETGKRKAFLFENDYYTEAGEVLRKMFLRAPLNYRRISSYFTARRFHPILRRFRPHYGIDYVAPYGTPVSAVADGIVTSAGANGGFGNYVELRHSNGFITSYGHLSRYAKAIRRGEKVKQGEVVGYVGATGLATGCHLDFRVKEKGKFINFLRLKNRSAGGLAAKKIPAFRETARPLDLKLEAELERLLEKRAAN